jgi:hypothetical protein
MRRWLDPLLLAVLSLFFMYAGVVKLLEPVAFARDIQAYQITGPLLSGVAALWIPWIEWLAALLAWPRGWRTAALSLLGVLLLVFQVALLSVLVRGLDISCGCLGAGLETGALLALLRNFVLLAGIGWILWPAFSRSR